MKAWLVQHRDESLWDDERRVEIVWAPTRERARQIVIHHPFYCELGIERYIDSRVTRLPALDGQPRTISARDGIEAGAFGWVECWGCRRHTSFDEGEWTVFTHDGHLLCDSCTGSDSVGPAVYQHTKDQGE